MKTDPLTILADQIAEEVINPTQDALEARAQAAEALATIITRLAQGYLWDLDGADLLEAISDRIESGDLTIIRRAAGDL